MNEKEYIDSLKKHIDELYKVIADYEGMYKELAEKFKLLNKDLIK